MRRIGKATADQAPRLFEIMLAATEVGGAPFYPREVMRVWHKGRSVEGMRGVIARGDVYSLEVDGAVRGFVHISDSEVLGLFVHPDDHGKGHGTELFRFALDRIPTRPVVLLSTLNAVPFYARLGCRTLATESVRRHDRDIYVVRMEFA